MEIPECVAVIMDGNRRWAKNKGLPTFAGHTAGYDKLKEFLKWTKEAGVSHVIAFAFSIENWKRSEEEVSFIITLLKKVFTEEAERFVTEETKVLFIGDLSLFSKEIVDGMRSLERKTEHFTERSVSLAVSYGGREEIVYAANQTFNEGKTEITVDDISRHLYTHGTPDPDIVIRTSGEMRLSGFLPWQSVYSELFFTETLWPDFSKDELSSILEQYGKRERRLGK